jgi:hypothetical protein
MRRLANSAGRMAALAMFAIGHEAEIEGVAAIVRQSPMPFSNESRGGHSDPERLCAAFGYLRSLMSQGACSFRNPLPALRLSSIPELTVS